VLNNWVRSTHQVSSTWHPEDREAGTSAVAGTINDRDARRPAVIPGASQARESGQRGDRR
jgi:hypothetical protein